MILEGKVREPLFFPSQFKEKKMPRNNQLFEKKREK
jgi:hypothetical protein